MKSPNKLLSSLIAGITTISVVQAQQYSASPVYTAPIIATDGQTATVSGSWSPDGISPVNFQAIISLAYSSTSVYKLGATSSGAAGSHDNYHYNLESVAPTHGDVITMNIDYFNIDQNGPTAGILWDSDPSFKFNHGFDNDKADYKATITNVPLQTIAQDQSVFTPFSSTFTISGSDPTSDGTSEGTSSGTVTDGGTKSGSTITKDAPQPTLTSDGLIFTSFKQGPSTWTATAVPEPSSALLLAIGSAFILRRRR